jgi:hypothetical protein
VRNLRKFLTDSKTEAERELNNNPELSSGSKQYWQGWLDCVEVAQRHLNEDTETAMSHLYQIVDGVNNA